MLVTTYINDNIFEIINKPSFQVKQIRINGEIVTNGNSNCVAA